MSQESTEEYHKNFSTNFRKALQGCDFRMVFTMWKWLEDRLRKRNVTDRVLAIRDFVDAHRREVMLRWYRRIYRLLSRKKHDEALHCYKDLQIRFPETKEAAYLLLRLKGNQVSHEFGDFRVMLAKAFFHDKDLDNCREFLLPLPSGEDVLEDTEIRAVLLYADVLIAEGREAEAVTLLEGRIKRNKKEERFKTVSALKNQLNAISPGSQPSREKKLEPARLVISGDIRKKGVVIFNGQRIGKPFSGSKRAFQLLATVAYLKVTNPVQGGFESSEIMGRLRGISLYRRKVSRTKEVPGYLREVTQEQGISPIRKTAPYIESTPVLAKIWRRDKRTGKCDIDLLPEQIDISSLVTSGL